MIFICACIYPGIYVCMYVHVFLRFFFIFMNYLVVVLYLHLATIKNE